MRALTVASIVSGCVTAPPPTPVQPQGDRDANDCNVAAGYQWCPRTGSCQRPADLATRVGFAPESFAGYCRIKRQ